jgi:PAS domain S-box-containing protein
MPEPSIEPPSFELTDPKFSFSSPETIETALRSSELRYRRLFETARDGILILDSEFGQVTDANPFMIELLGYELGQLLGKELWEIGLLKDKKASQGAFQRLKQDGYIRYDNLPLENRRGVRREVEFVSNLYLENGSVIIQCNIRDITERKRAEAILAAAATRNERIADLLQASMLQSFPTDNFHGISVETLYEPALDEALVGGDFFDAFLLDSDKIVLVAGDVSGKGLAAAGRTSEVKYALRTLLHEHQIPNIAISHLNEFIYKTHSFGKNDSETFIVLAVALVNTTTGNTIFSSAGAEPSLILRTNGRVELVELSGMPLGIQSGAEYANADRVLQLGDTVFMATDGITEARNEHDFLGVDGLVSLIELAGPELTLQQLGREIYLGAREFARGLLRDDVCLLLARRR